MHPCTISALSQTDLCTTHEKHHLFRPIREGLVLLLRLPLLDEWQKLWLTRDVFAQHLRDVEAFWRLVVFEDTTECSFSCTD
jgi:hypothetical protein